jgi:hypothetical protein
MIGARPSILIAPWTLLRANGQLPATLALALSVRLFAKRGPNVEGIIHLDPVNTWYENTRYGSGIKVAAFTLAPVRICVENQQYGGRGETAADNDVSRIHDHAPVGSNQLSSRPT